MSKKHIPNWDTVSTLIDRISIETVKEVTFEDRLQQLQRAEENKVKIKELESKINQQVIMRTLLRKELSKLLNETFIQGSYSSIEEARTFD